MFAVSLIKSDSGFDIFVNESKVCSGSDKNQALDKFRELFDEKFCILATHSPGQNKGIRLNSFNKINIIKE